MIEGIASSEKILQLERRHTELISELDTLNNRLEQALTGFVKLLEPSTNGAELTAETAQ